MFQTQHHEMVIDFHETIPRKGVAKKVDARSARRSLEEERSETILFPFAIICCIDGYVSLRLFKYLEANH